MAPINDEAKKHNGSLPGMGGVFNLVKMHVYHYAGNIPVKLVDPEKKLLHFSNLNRNLKEDPIKGVIGSSFDYMVSIN